MRRWSLLTAVTTAALAVSLSAAPAHATRPLTAQDYRYFRALSIDLTGAVPSPQDIAAFEADGFNLDAWIDAHLDGHAYTQQQLSGTGFDPATPGRGYVDRLTSIYMDRLRLRVGPQFLIYFYATWLDRVQVVGPDGRRIFVYYRSSQRRRPADNAGHGFCLSQSELGFVPGRGDPNDAAPPSGAIPVSQATLDAHTTVVRPWWLYSDYRSANPTDLFDPSFGPNGGFHRTPRPGYVPTHWMLQDPDGSPATEIRVCNDEAQTAENAPADDGSGPVSCRSGSGVGMATGCGCGPGLEWCQPLPHYAFAWDTHTTIPLGYDQPFNTVQSGSYPYNKFWWGEEVVHLFNYVFGEDHDFRDVLTARYALENGPMRQFYQATADARCCRAEFLAIPSGVPQLMRQPTPLFDPHALPDDLGPQDVSRWALVPDRGSLASGFLTMPAFLTKFGSRRAKAHVLYQTFLCRDFVAPTIQLRATAHPEPDLRVREGCSACHAALEPLAAYFSRYVQSELVFMPPSLVPSLNPSCHATADGGAPGNWCTSIYDPALGYGLTGTFAGTASSLAANADAGAAGIAQYLTGHHDFAGCVTDTIAGSFLGRQLSSDDAALRQSLTDAFVASGYRPRALVRALVRSDAYRRVNNLESGAWRAGGAQ